VAAMTARLRFGICVLANCSTPLMVTLMQLNPHHQLQPNNHILVSGSWDNRIKVWNLETGTLMRTLNGHVDDVTLLQSVQTGFFSCQWQCRQDYQALETHWSRTPWDTDWLKSVAFSPDGQTLAMAIDGTIKIWQLDTRYGQDRCPPLRTLVGHSNQCLLPSARMGKP